MLHSLRVGVTTWPVILYCEVAGVWVEGGRAFISEKEYYCCMLILTLEIVFSELEGTP